MSTEQAEVKTAPKMVNSRSLGRALLLLAFCPLLMAQSAASNQKSTPPLATGTPPASGPWDLPGKPPPPSAYAGNAACAQCHQKIAEEYAKTNHALDSTLPSAEAIRGSFARSQAVFRTINPSLIFVMTATPAGFFQTAVNTSNPRHLTAQMQRFDIVVGSGRHGQSYLYWAGDLLYELPVSYWTEKHEWVNSPGYPAGELRWDRPVGPRCLECHASYFRWLPPPVNRYAKSSLRLGITCERCHGPGALHVARERSAHPPGIGSPNIAIVNPARLSREQQMSLCSLCHAGGGTPIRAPMSFVVGDNIHKYLRITPPPLNKPVDVHANQVGALEQSKCYSSGKLTCLTCHDVHKPPEKANAYSKYCLECHQVKSCGRYPALGASIRGRCIQCHMPILKSRVLTTADHGKVMHLNLRSHRIAIYPQYASLGNAEDHASAPQH